MKRSIDGGGPGAKKGAASNSDGKTDPIPRPLYEQSVTLTFKRLTWETIAPQELKYLPLCMTPKYMLTPADQVKIKRFESTMWSTMTIEKVQARATNLVMLQDDLRVQSNTPTDATAFTQVIYLIHYCPKMTPLYFKLENNMKESALEGNTISYNFNQLRDTIQPQLITLNNYEDFSKLLLVPARVNETAGFVPKQNITLKGGTGDDKYSILDTYIAPNTNTSLRKYSCNLQPENSKGALISNFVQPLGSTMKASDLNGMHFYKYGDTIDLPITTNLHGVKLMNVEQNAFYNTYFETIQDGTDSVNYATEFIWPGRNRPFYSRHDNLSIDVDVISSAKRMLPLQHHFFSMPPIYKPNGALLGQRCNLTLEQELIIKFHTTESFHTDELADDVLAQSDAVVVRPAVYGKTLKEGSAGVQSVLCGNNQQAICKSEPIQDSDHRQFQKAIPRNIDIIVPGRCFEDTWDGMDIALGKLPDTVLQRAFDITDALPPGDYGYIEIPYLDMLVFKGSKEFQQIWYKYMNREKGYIVFHITQPTPIGGTSQYWYAIFGTAAEGQSVIKYTKDEDLPLPKYLIMFTDKLVQLIYDNYDMRCTIVSGADYRPHTKEAFCFYT